MTNRPDALTSATYPRVYRAAGFWKVAMTLCSILLIGGPAVGVWFAIAGNDQTLHGRIVLASLCLVFFAVGVYCLLWVFKAQLVLFADRISIEGPFATTVLRIDELSGWRFMPTSPLTLVLQPKERRTRAKKIGLLFPIDEQFTNWLDTFPALDIEDAEASAAEIFEDHTLGNTPSEREQTLRGGLNRAKILNGISTVAGLLAIFYPRPYLALMLILVALPWIAAETMRRSNGLIRADQIRNDAHPNIAFALMLPACALPLRAVLDYNVLESITVLTWSLAIAVALNVAIVIADPTVRRKAANVILFFAFSLAYAYGATIEVNGMRDRSAPVNYPATVQGKHINNGKRTTYQLELAPWGPKTGKNDLEVSNATYKNIQPGDTVLLNVKTGLLGVKWYYLLTWQRGNSSTPVPQHPEGDIR